MSADELVAQAWVALKKVQTSKGRRVCGRTWPTIAKAVQCAAGDQTGDDQELGGARC